MAMRADLEQIVPPKEVAARDSGRPSGAGSVPPRRDPFAAVLALGRRQVRTGLAIGIAGALVVHGSAAGTAANHLSAMTAFARDVRSFVLDSMFAQYDVEMLKPPPPPPAPEEKPAPPEEAQKPVAKAPDKPPSEAEEKPPEPAQAGKVLTSDPDPNAPLDFTGDGFVSGNADHFAGGETASNGTSAKPVYNRNAKPGGVEGGKGTGPVRVAAPEKPAADLSRTAMPLNRGGNWSCPFPSQADADQIDYARVLIVVTVGADGRARSAVVSSDPGHGFGSAAQRCAMGQQYETGLDTAGKPVTRTTPPFTVVFTR